MKKYYTFTSLLLFILVSSPAQTPSLQWVQTVGSASTGESGNGVQIDATNSLYVNLGLNGSADIDPGAGTTIVPAGSYDAKYDANGNFKSYAPIAGGLADSYIYKNGYTYLYGYFDSTYDFDPGVGVNKINSLYTDFCVAKYSSDNTLLWVDDFTGSDANSQLGGGITIGEDGNCYVRGYIYGNTVDMDPSPNTKLLQGDANAQYNYIAAAYDANGNYKWAFKLDVTNLDNSFPALVYGNNEVFLAGNITDSADLDPGVATHTIRASSTAETSFLAAYDTNGNYLWGYAYQSDGRVAIEGMQIDGSGHIVIKAFHQDDVNVNLGPGFNNVPGNGYFLAKYSLDGNYIWGIPIAPSGFTSLNPFAMTIDPQNNILLGGADYSADSFNIAVVKYNANGSEVWNFKLNNYGGTDVCRGIVTDHSGNFYITGAFANTVDFDPGSGVNSKTSLGGQDAFFAKYQDNSILPVTLISFSGKSDNKQNILYWSTSTEEENTGFEVQRSVDGNNFIEIGFVNTNAANGNASTKKNYDFTDNNIASTINYYRLRQTDKDGGFTFSNIVKLENDNFSKNIFIYPTPAGSILNVKIPTPNDQNYKISLFITDISGRTLQNVIIQTSNGAPVIYLDISNLPHGNYVLKTLLPWNNEVVEKIFMKQ